MKRLRIAALGGALLAGRRRWSAFDGRRSKASIDATGNTSARSSLDRPARPAPADDVPPPPTRTKP